MEILDSVALDEIPKEAERLGIKGVWTGLAQKSIDDHERGQVTVIRLPDDEAYKRMRNGVADYLRQRSYTLDAVTVRDDSGMKIFMQLRQKGGSSARNSR